MKIALVLALVALFVAAAAGQSCRLTVSQTLSSSWTSNGQAFSQWSVTLNNAGSQAVLSATINVANSANLDQIWNAEKVGTTDNYNLPAYLAQNGGIAVGASYQFGYIVKASTQAAVTVVTASCAGASPAASPAASAAASPAASAAASPAASAAASPAASASPVVVASSAPSACRAAVNAVPRPAANGGVWTDGPYTYQIVDLTATNAGSQPITNIRLAVTLSAGAIISQSWELTVADGVYSIPTPYGPLQVGASQGAGFIVRSAAGASGPASASVSVAAVTCSGGAAASPAASASPVVVASAQPQPSNAPAGCALRLSLTKRAGDNFNDANGYNQAFDLTATNIGSRPVTLAQIKLALASDVAVAQFYQLARIDASTFSLTAPTQYGPIQVGASAQAAIIAATKTVGAKDVATPTVTLSAINCQ